jgi:hypothetical protein
VLVLGIASIIVGVVCLAGWFAFRGAYERGVRRKYQNPKQADTQLKIAPWVMLFIVAVGVVEILASFLR